MSFSPQGLHGCPEIQAELDSYFETCDSSLLPDPAPLNEFLWSPLNRSGIQQLLTPSENKIRTLVLRYDQRILESDVEEVDSCERVCTTTTKRGDLTQEYTIDTCNVLRYGNLINANDFKEACRSNFEIINKKLRLMMNVMLRKVATKMTALAAGHVGVWPSDAGTIVAGELVVNTLKTGSTTDIDPRSIEDIDFALKFANYCNGAAIFSGRTLSKYINLMSKGCCSAAGYDLEKLFAAYGFASMFDRRLHNEIGADYALAIAPKALQPVYYVKNNDGVNDAIGLNVGANYQKQVIYEPSTGLPIDLTLSDDCGNVSIIMETVVDLKALPSDLYAPGDYMEGVTGVGKIKVVNT